MDLRTWRKRNGITQVTLSEELGIRQSHLSKLEQRKVGASLALAGRILKATSGQVELETLLKKTTGV